MKLEELQEPTEITGPAIRLTDPTGDIYIIKVLDPETGKVEPVKWDPDWHLGSVCMDGQGVNDGKN